MFEEWPSSFERRLRHELDPPVPVVVDLAVAIPTPGGRFRDSLPLAVTQGGLQVSDRVPGMLLAWARTTTGAWIGLVEAVIVTGSRQGRVPIRQWCSAAALEPRNRA